MLNEPFNSFSQIEEAGLQVFQDQLAPYPVNSSHNSFNRLKHPIFDILLQYSK
jgi:hypothetical protein